MRRLLAHARTRGNRDGLVLAPASGDGRVGFGRGGTARFPKVAAKAGHYESFYIKACRPGGGQGLWIRHTVHKRPGAEPNASIWFCLFDREAEGPRATKVTVPAGGALDPGRVLDPGRRSRDRPRAGERIDRDRGADGVLGADVRRRRRALQVPAGRLALRGAGSAHQVRRPVPRRPLQRPARDRR